MINKQGQRSFHLLIDPRVLREAKKRSIDADQNLKDVIESLLKMWVEGRVKIIEAAAEVVKSR